MYPVTIIAESAPQPPKGYLPVNAFESVEYNDGVELPKIAAQYAWKVGLVTDYMSRFALTSNRVSSFDISLRGANIVHQKSDAKEILSHINGMDREALCAAFQLICYDVAYRKGPQNFAGVDEEEPPQEILQATAIMIRRSIAFFQNYEMPIKCGFTLDGGYSALVSKGDGDYLTSTTLLDMKCSAKELNTKWTLQLLMYYIMGQQSIFQEFKKLTRIGFFNPYKNIFYYCDIEKIPNAVLYNVSKNVIGYSMRQNALYGGVSTRDLQRVYKSWREVSNCQNIEMLKYWIGKNFKQTSFNPNMYDDGMLYITLDDYWTFMQQSGTNRGTRPLFPNTKEVIFLKKSGFYMFISVNKNGTYALMDGARLKQLGKDKSIMNYYYNYMDLYAEKILSCFLPYWQVLNQISTALKQLQPDTRGLYTDFCTKIESINERAGLNIALPTYQEYQTSPLKMGQTALQRDVAEYCNQLGRIHGCIVDISPVNHIYVSPYDGSITPYTAASMYDRTVYKSIRDLIADKRALLLSDYTRKFPSEQLLCVGAGHLELTYSNAAVKGDSETERQTDIGMYKISNKILGFQHIFDQHVITVWNEAVIKYLNKEHLTKQEIVKMLDLMPFEGTDEYKQNAAKTYSLVGARNRMNCGMVATVIEDNGYNDITVKFDNGCIRTHRTRYQFQKGKISNKCSDK